MVVTSFGRITRLQQGVLKAVQQAPTRTALLTNTSIIVVEFESGNPSHLDVLE